MNNFFECIEDGGEPISDVATHVRTMTSCHLANIALMLGRELNWDPQHERFEGDEQATALMSRPRRDKYSLAATTYDESGLVLPRNSGCSGRHVRQLPNMRNPRGLSKGCQTTKDLHTGIWRGCAKLSSAFETR